ncbi:MAG TPA: metallophosphoesterase [Clostridia bacterium]|nr:metallophosphoesterase [Clostridia bacterium]
MRRSHPGSALAIVAVILCCFQFAAAQQALELNLRPPFKFIAYGDIRFLDPSNTKDSDPVRRKLIVEKIVSEKPEFVLISGDLVARGDRASDWQAWDAETAAFPRSKIRVLPALGNHDLRGDLGVALGNYFQRFPELKQSRWYSARAGNVLVLTLDSSIDPGADTIDQQGAAGIAASKAQTRWLEQQLDAIPHDVDFVIFNLHHPPYTRSQSNAHGGGHSVREAEKRIAGMLEDRQAHTRARFVVIAGHVHNYERYEHGGVTYIVSGGGGATPYEIPRQPDDVYTDPGPTYHYCVLNVDKGKLGFSMMKLEMKGNKADWQERDFFTLTPAKAAAATAKH